MFEWTLGFFLIFPFLYDFFPSWVKYFTKISTYYFFLTFFSVFVVIPLSLFRPKNVENMLISAFVMNPVSTLLGIKWKVIDMEKLSNQKSCVVVLNHQHAIDVLALFHLWPIMFRCTAIAKKLLLFAGPFGIAAWLCGTTFIDRRKSKESWSVLNQKVLQAKDSNTKVLIFPEGTRHHSKGDKTLLPFKKGAFRSAIDAQLPVLPIVIGHYDFLDAKKKQFGESEIQIRILDPISTKGMSPDDVDNLTSRVQTEMLQVFKTT